MYYELFCIFATEMRKLLTLILTMMALCSHAADTDGDTARHVGFTVYAYPQWQIAMDEYERQWLCDKRAFAVGVELNYRALPSDSDAFARDYNYPTLSVGAKLALNNGVTMRRTGSWGKAVMVDYDSRLGDIFTLYGSFERPLLRTRRWELNYMLRAGVGYSPFIYNKTDNIDNELIGSAFNIYFGAGVTASYQLTDNLALVAGLLYGHHSNGALARPNKGENHWGPMVGIRSGLTPHPLQKERGPQKTSPDFISTSVSALAARRCWRTGNVHSSTPTRWSQTIARKTSTSTCPTPLLPP